MVGHSAGLGIWRYDVVEELPDSAEGDVPLEILIAMSEEEEEEDRELEVEDWKDFENDEREREVREARRLRMLEVISELRQSEEGYRKQYETLVQRRARLREQRALAEYIDTEERRREKPRSLSEILKDVVVRYGKAVAISYAMYKAKEALFPDRADGED